MDNSGDTMKERLLFEPRGDDNGSTDAWAAVAEEVKKVSFITGPRVAVTMSQYLLQMVSVIMVGHLGELALSSTTIAISLASLSGFSLLMGMSAALETLCGQAFGAKQYSKLGTQTYAANFSLVLVCILLSILWLYMGKILVFIGQDPLISREAGKFLVWLVPALFAYSFLQPLVRYFQTEAHHRHVDKAALATGISYWLNAIILLLYMRYSAACTKTSAPISAEVLRGIPEFFCFAVPSAVIICAWWSFELLILLSGLLPNPQLETSVLSVSLSTISTLYTIPFGVGAAGSTRVSNGLGAGNTRAARTAVFAVMLIAVSETTVTATILFAVRKFFGYAYSNEKELVDYVTSMSPLTCLSVILDSLQGVLSGVARGCGWQHIGAYKNLGAFYLCGIPVAAALAFYVGLRGIGLWIGIQSGAFVQMMMLITVTSCTDWEMQVQSDPLAIHYNLGFRVFILKPGCLVDSCWRVKQGKGSFKGDCQEMVE